MTIEQYRIWLAAYEKLCVEIPNFVEKYNIKKKSSAIVGALDLDGDFGDYENYDVGSDLENLLRSLSGPFAVTILKAYRIKRGLEP